MGQDYPFNTAQEANYWHQFFVQGDPEGLDDWHDAVQEVCDGPFIIQEEYGRIAVPLEADAKKLAAHDHLVINGDKRQIVMVPRERTLSYLADEIRKEFRQFDIQINYSVGYDFDSVNYLEGYIFIRPFDDDEADFKIVADEITQKYGNLGVTARCRDEKFLLDLYVAGH